MDINPLYGRLVNVKLASAMLSFDRQATALHATIEKLLNPLTRISGPATEATNSSCLVKYSWFHQNNRPIIKSFHYILP